MANTTVSTTSLNSILGSDAQYPINGNFVDISGIPLLLQDMQRLLLTVPGERINRPDFGCNLRNQIWENITTAATVGAASIREALEKYEPRITVVGIDSNINANTGLIIFTIRFVINSTDTAANLVFPFRAGTNLSFS